MPRLGAMQLEEDKITVFSYSIISNTLLYKQYDYVFYISHLPKFEYLGPKAGRYSGNATKLSGKTLMLVTRALICICCVVAMWRKHYTLYSIQYTQRCLHTCRKGKMLLRVQLCIEYKTGLNF